MNSEIRVVEKYLQGKILTLESVDKKKLHRYVKVFINGNWLGVTNNILKIHNDLRNMRFRGELEKTVSLVIDYSNREFHIYTEGGRLIRPYLTVSNNQLNFKPEMLEDVKTWDEFITKYPYVVEYVDKEEEQNIMLAIFPEYIEKANHIMNRPPINNSEEINRINRTNRYDDNVYPRYSHCEIHPCMILGLISSNIPFPDHNQSPRGIFQYNQARQAMGLYISDYKERTDISYILYHPQIPIVASRASKYTGTHIFPAGENAIVSIMSYNGYNQEDSLLINKSAIDKGLFRAQALKKYFETIKKNPASSQTGIFLKPDRNNVDNMKVANYDKLNEEGYVDVETVIVEGDVIIGMVNPKPPTRKTEKAYKDSSTIFKSLVPGTIDKVITGVNNDGYPIIKIRVRSERIPEIGDKFSSRAGQKGTMGGNPSRWDMPFTPYGLIPDIIINPNAIPKRMTIGQLIECLLSKVCAIKGLYGDATPFTGVDIKKINEELVAAGFEEWGAETMYNGMTGLKMETKIFIGPTYYQRLKQMVGDKAHCLSTDHEVLTMNGWKFHHELSTKDKVATLVDNKLIYQNPKQIYYYTKYCGSMYHVETSHIDLMVTGNHRMWVSKNNGKNKWANYDFELAENLVGQTCRYQTNAVWDAPDYQFVLQKYTSDSGIFYSEHQPCMNSWLEFFGIWMNHGWISDNSIIGINIENKNMVDKLISVLNNLKYSYQHDQKKFTIMNEQLHSYLKELSQTKFPDWVWQLSCNQARQLLASMIGEQSEHVDTINDNIFQTKSESLLDQVMQLVLHCGWSSTKLSSTEKTTDWYLLITKNGDTVVNDWDTKTSEQIISNYNGPVFCLKVNGGVFYVRRNGKPVWTGNSRSRGVTQLLTRQPSEGRSRDGGLRFGEMERDAIGAHGMAQFLKERTVDNSDIYTAYICDTCGLFAHKMPNQDYYTCRACQNSTRISKIIIPYAFKLFMQELRSINILGRIRTSKSIVVPRR